VDDAFDRHYGLGQERDRLGGGSDALELVRTLELLDRFLPAPPARVLDVGGGPGVYAERLAQRGYDVHLIDVFPEHVEQARARSAVFAADVGDARDLSAFDDEGADVVLLLGPLYHLTERADRVQSLSEARRVVRRGGIVGVAAISRYASLLDGVASGMLDDPAFAEIVARDLRDGQHRNPEHNERWFTTAYFHLPEELAAEVAEAGLQVQLLAGVEGPGGWLRRWPEEREQIVAGAARSEHLAALSAHMLRVATRG
jgi:ubiquinone/menaquinone biosynthesis C-methylase UbiE